MKSILNHAGNAFRFAGDIGNFGAFLAFAWAAFHLKGMAIERFESAGGVDALSYASLANTVTAAMSSDTPMSVAVPAMTSYAHMGAAWLLAIAAAGCGWMAVLGGRWSFHFVLRLLNR